MAQYEVPDHLLDRLKCALCYEPLSHPPIMLYAETGSVCGRCPALESEKNMQPLREKNFEDLGSILTFPCRYKSNGCDQVLTMKKVPVHEQTCQYKPYFCPVLPLGSCAWQGLPVELHGHFAMNHSEFIKETPEFELDIVNNYQEILLIPMHGELFIFRIEYQNSDDKFRARLHIVGNTDAQYEYELEFTTSGLSYTLPKMNVENDSNLMDRTNEYVVALPELRENLNEPTFIMCHVKIFLIRAEMVSVASALADCNLTTGGGTTTTTTDDNCDGSDDDECSSASMKQRLSAASNKLLEDLECPVCQECMVPPIFQCVTGHSVCNICKPQLTECPTCRGQMSNTRNFTLEKITENISYVCKNIDEGCCFQGNSSTIRAHETACNYKPNQCPLHETLDCEWLGNWNKFRQHCKKTHADLIQSGTLCQLKYNDSCVQFQTYRIKIEHGLDFLIRYSYTNTKVACTVLCIMPPQTSDAEMKFIYEMQILDANNKGLLLVSKKPCGLLTDDKDDLKHCSLWHLDMVKPLISCTENNLKFKCIIYKV